MEQDVSNNLRELRLGLAKLEGELASQNSEFKQMSQINLILNQQIVEHQEMLEQFNDMLSDENGMPLRISMKTALRNDITQDVMRALDYHTQIAKIEQSIKDESNKFTTVNKYLLDLNQQIQSQSVFIQQNQKELSYCQSQMIFVKSNADRFQRQINEMKLQITKLQQLEIKFNDMNHVDEEKREGIVTFDDLFKLHDIIQRENVSRNEFDVYLQSLENNLENQIAPLCTKQLVDKKVKDIDDQLIRIATRFENQLFDFLRKDLFEMIFQDYKETIGQKIETIENNHKIQQQLTSEQLYQLENEVKGIIQSSEKRSQEIFDKIKQNNLLIQSFDEQFISSIQSQQEQKVVEYKIQELYKFIGNYVKDAIHKDQEETITQIEAFTKDISELKKHSTNSQSDILLIEDDQKQLKAQIQSLEKTTSTDLLPRVEFGHYQGEIVEIHKTFLVERHRAELRSDLEKQIEKVLRGLELRMQHLQEDIQGILKFEYATQEDFFNQELERLKINVDDGYGSSQIANANLIASQASLIDINPYQLRPGTQLQICQKDLKWIAQNRKMYTDVQNLTNSIKSKAEKGDMIKLFQEKASKQFVTNLMNMIDLHQKQLVFGILSLNLFIKTSMEKKYGGDVIINKDAQREIILKQTSKLLSWMSTVVHGSAPHELSSQLSPFHQATRGTALVDFKKLENIVDDVFRKYQKFHNSMENRGPDLKFVQEEFQILDQYIRCLSPEDMMPHKTVQIQRSLTIDGQRENEMREISKNMVKDSILVDRMKEVDKSYDWEDNSGMRNGQRNLNGSHVIVAAGSFNTERAGRHDTSNNQMPYYGMQSQDLSGSQTGRMTIDEQTYETQRNQNFLRIQQGGAILNNSKGLSLHNTSSPNAAGSLSSANQQVIAIMNVEDSPEDADIFSRPSTSQSIPSGFRYFSKQRPFASQVQPIQSNPYDFDPHSKSSIQSNTAANSTHEVPSQTLDSFNINLTQETFQDKLLTEKTIPENQNYDNQLNHFSQSLQLREKQQPATSDEIQRKNYKTNLN